MNKPSPEQLAKLAQNQIDRVTPEERLKLQQARMKALSHIDKEGAKQKKPLWLVPALSMAVVASLVYWQQPLSPELNHSSLDNTQQAMLDGFDLLLDEDPEMLADIEFTLWLTEKLAQQSEEQI